MGIAVLTKETIVLVHLLLVGAVFLKVLLGKKWFLTMEINWSRNQNCLFVFFLVGGGKELGFDTHFGLTLTGFLVDL